ncbi:MAG TPA: DUF1292 domain-containing protein [Clostridiales bacterium]|jgi:uncharacterized protein YrzB (UPF0473 family)|nr:DUF1292 domain-containing protein [Lachnospiraceae bacterium]HAQ39985.1 DUF1292 domain-containing protein [Clostridiales bacterium]
MEKNNDNFDEFDEFDDEDVIESITVTDEDGNEIEFYILDVVEHKGGTYLLVIEDIEDDDTEATIIKEVEVDGDDVVYELIEDEEEFNIIAELFENNNEDYDIEL